jgi:hypothetical protein
MALARFDFEELSQKMADAVAKETPLVDKLRSEVRKLQVRKLGDRPCRTIAPVATDGGENRLSFEPLNIEIIRVVDSNGTDLFQTVIPLSEDSKVFESYVSHVPTLQKLLQLLGDLPFDELSFLIGSGTTSGEVIAATSDLRGQVRAFRDVVEWAVLLDLASRDWPTDVLLLRDGLLRSKIFKRKTFPLLDNAFKRTFDEQSHPQRHRVYLLGVAKRSAVISKLSLALMLEGTFDKDYPCYVEVPRDLEAQCYNFDRTWLDTAEEEDNSTTKLYQSFGRLHLVKLSSMRTAPVLPVDIPIWLPAKDRQIVLEYLAHDAASTFPTIGYPHSLQKAHEYAVMNGLEMTVIADIMVDNLIKRMAPEFAEKVLRHVNLGRGLLKGGARHGD